MSTNTRSKKRNNRRYLYAFRPMYAYSGGVLIVAAKTLEEAQKVVASTSHRSDYLDLGEQLPGVTVSTRKSQIIDDSVYIE